MPRTLDYFPMATAKKKTPGRIWSARLKQPLEKRLIAWADGYGLVDESGDVEPTQVIRTFLTVHLARPGKSDEQQSHGSV